MDDMTQTKTKTLKSADTQTTIPTPEPEPEPKPEEPIIEPNQTKANENPQNLTLVNPNAEIEVPVITKVKFNSSSIPVNLIRNIALRYIK